MTRPPLYGIYAITPDWPDPERVYTAALAALAGGIRLLQLRYKGDAKSRRALAIKLHSACAAHQAALIINDDLELALEIHAQGLHLGEHDGNLARARARLFPDQILGASCYNRLDLARTAMAAGSDYVAFGSVFDSGTKPNAVRAPLELFAQARELNLPCIAIGGITLDNAQQVFDAGADAVAIISDLFEQEDIQARAAALCALAHRA